MQLTKSKANFIVDALILLAFLGEAITGFVLWVVLPSGGYQGGRGTSSALRTFVFERSAWLGLHDWLAVTLVAGTLLHVVLHWDWITCMTRNMWKESFGSKKETQASPQECQI